MSCEAPMLLRKILEQFEQETIVREANELVRCQELGDLKAVFLGHYLTSVFQPVFYRQGDYLNVAGFEAFVRPITGEKTVDVRAFFGDLSAEDTALLDRVCVDLHIENFLTSTREPEFLSLIVEPRALVHQLERFEDFKQGLKRAKENGLPTQRVWIKLDLCPDLDPGIIYSFADQVREIGVRIALSGFDCDYASFSRIIHNKPDAVIFNRSWLRQGIHNPSTVRITAEVVKTLKSLAIAPHLERIETREELNFAVQCGFERFQGYYLQGPERKVRRDTIDLSRVPSAA